jgi:hypothetical protein
MIAPAAEYYPRRIVSSARGRSPKLLGARQDQPWAIMVNDELKGSGRRQEDLP